MSWFHRRRPGLPSQARPDVAADPNENPSALAWSQPYNAQHGADRRLEVATSRTAGGENATATEYNSEDEAVGGGSTAPVHRRQGHNDPYVFQQDLSRVPGDYRRTGPIVDRYPPGHTRRSQSPPRLQRSNVADDSRKSSRRHSPPAPTVTREPVVRQAGPPPPAPRASIQAPPEQLSVESAAAILATMPTAPVKQIARTHVQARDTPSSDGSTASSQTRSPSPVSPPQVAGNSAVRGAPSAAQAALSGQAATVAPPAARRPARGPPPAPPARAAYAAPVPPPAYYPGPPPLAHGYPPQVQYGYPPPMPHGPPPPMMPAYPQHMGPGYAPPPPPMGHAYPAYMYAPAAPAAAPAGPPAPPAYPALTDSPTYPRFTENLPPPPGPPRGRKRRYPCYGFHCNQVFDMLTEYETHMNQHEKKPFKCELCPNGSKGFVRTAERRRHVRDFHAGTGYEKYV